jgi:hypothetical protein
MKHLYFQGVLFSAQFLVPSTNQIVWGTDNFTRRLRLKEHFCSKEVEGGDEVSSDSDSDDARDYKYVNKKWMGPET